MIFLFDVQFMFFTIFFKRAALVRLYSCRYHTCYILGLVQDCKLESICPCLAMEDKDNMPRLQAAPMELHLLKMLQSMKRIEDDPENHFQTKNINLKTFTPKYSKVAIVAQDTKKALDYINSIVKSLSFASNIRTICVALTQALRDLSLENCKSGDWSGWTIIMMEGLYINPSLSTHWCVNCPSGHPVYPKFEIVGVDDVRVLWSTVALACIRPLSGDVTFKNIRFFDLRERSSPEKFITFDLEKKAKISFYDATMAGPGSRPFLATAATISLNCCSIVDVGMAFWIFESTLLLESCHLVKASTAGEFKECQIIIRDSFITKSGRMVITDKSRCLVRDTEIHSCPTGPTVADVEWMAFTVRTKSSLRCERCSFDGFAAAGVAYKSKTSLVLSQCRITDCLAALVLCDNASGKCLDSYVDCRALMAINHNVKGKAEFKRNKFGPHVTATPNFSVDAVSNKPLHDVENAVFFHLPLVSNPSPKSRSQFYDWLRTTSDDQRSECFENPFSTLHLMKQCGWCMKGEFIKNHFPGVEEEDEGKKHTYCKDCLQVCYCSKECQVADWPDHKHFCHLLAGARQNKENGGGDEPCNGGHEFPPGPSSGVPSETSDEVACDENKLERQFQSLTTDEVQKRGGSSETPADSTTATGSNGDPNPSDMDKGFCAQS